MGPAEDQCVKEAMSGFQSFGSWLMDNLIGVAQGGQEIDAFRLQHDTGLCLMKKSLDPVDQNALKLPGVTDILYEANIEAFRQGARGVTWDGRVITGSWGFDLQDINETVDVYLWHGDKDKSISYQIGQCVAESIPNCKFKIVPDEGHISLRLNYAEEILNILTSGW
jgi:pimeloyl-ACP methyl ester carboxylesterase